MQKISNKSFMDYVDFEAPKKLAAFTCLSLSEFADNVHMKLSVEDIKRRDIFSWYAHNIWGWTSTDISEHFKVSERQARRYIKDGGKYDPNE